jgi:hypothetical protein
MENNIIISEDQVKARQSAFITNVYGLMTGALAITGVLAWFVSTDVNLLVQVASYFRILLIVEFLVVLGLSAVVNSVSVNVARALFVLYAALNGLTFGVIFSAFTGESIASTFFITGGTFGVMSLYGYFTKKDLTSWGRILMMGLIGIIIASIANIFMHSTGLYWIVTYIGVLVFVGLIAYDTQKLKNLAVNIEGEEITHKASIIGALALYLDFINLFLMLLRIFGRRK